jgi:hypothetical protein
MANDFINAGQFTIGPNNSISILDSVTNQEMDWGLATQINFDSKPLNVRVPVSLMRGTKVDLIFQQGRSGSLSIQRTNSNLDVYWSTLEAQIRAGLPRPTWSIIQTIKETDGTITQINYVQSQITYDESGTYTNEQGVVQMLNFTAPAARVTKI